MRTSHILAGLLAFSLFTASCVRKTEVNPTEPKPKAGKTGLTTLRITPQHHEKNIDSCWVYLKYNATARPDDGMYDDSLLVTPQDGKPIAKFTFLNKGDYYVYGVGYDPDIAEPVVGGTSFTVIDTLEKTYDIYLAVTEIGGH